MTLPEVLLWNVLRGRRAGSGFRHQHAAGPYVLDFYCAKAALCIEIDGKAHDMGTNPQRDERRDAWLAGRGIRTLRIPAEEILRDVEPVLQLIELECASRRHLKSSPRFRGEGDHAQHGGGASSGQKRPLHQPAVGPPPPESRGRIGEGP